MSAPHQGGRFLHRTLGSPAVNADEMAGTKASLV